VTRPRVGVIGGGLAGIAAALEAADRGADVLLVERRPSLGGLTSSIRRHGLSFDNGQHVFLRCCSSYRDFLERIGASSQVTIQRRLDVPVLAPDGRRASIRRSRLPAPLHLGGALLRYRHLSVHERLLLAGVAVALLRLDPADACLDELTFGDWLRAHGQSDRAVDRLWNLIALPTLNVAAAEASLQLAVTVFRVGLLDRADAGDIGWSNVPLAELHGEHGIRALEAAGVETLLGSPVTALESPARAGFFMATSGWRREVDAVVVAVPPRTAVALGVLPPAVATGLGSSPIVNVHLVLDRRVTDLPLAACIDSPIQFVFDRTVSSGATKGQCLAISLSAADSYLDQGTPELVERFMSALADLFPAARDARLLHAVVTRERAATFRARPGSGALRPSAATNTPGLYLAGAFCDTGWPATMEGAVRSGRHAAAEAMGFLAGHTSMRDRQLEEVVR
jgi:squalene-associated FAD-dependent desaturase